MTTTPAAPPDPPPRMCTTCGIRPRQPGQRKCAECHAEYMRNWRQKQTTIRLTDDNYEYLRLRSFTERISVSRLINAAITDERVRRTGGELGAVRKDRRP